MAVQFEAVCGPKFMTFCDDVGDPLQLSTVYRVSFPKIQAVNLPLSCEVGQKGWFWAPDLQGKGIPQISDMRFQIAVTSEHASDFG